MSARNTFAATRRSHTILGWLKNGQKVTINRVSDEFGVQYPQAREDLKLLEEIYGLETGRDGRTKYWQMPHISTQTAMIGTVAALELGGVALDLFKETPFGEFIDQMAHNQRMALAESQRERMERLASGLSLRRTWLPVERERMLEMIEALLEAIQNRRGVSFTYERSSDGEQKTYLAVPRRLIWYQGRLWLQATEHQKRKLFDVAGVLSMEQLNLERFVERLARERREELESFVYQGEPSAMITAAGGSGAVGDEGAALLEPTPARAVERARERAWQAMLRQQVEEEMAIGPAEDEEDYFKNAFGIYAYSGQAEQVQLVVRGSWATYLKRYRLHPSQQNEDTEEGLRVSFELAICPEFRSFVLGMLPEVEVLQPVALREALEDRVRQWLEG
ncbi:hypothetical protein DL240_12840 [Lujinxingia litoralis]|uniref:Uncharacterized protein n=1 Tax=Lujinxingia litoralis TaxID=2211119 RepID=A0A328C3W5_9DELT|nr:WYL domain-containing protein [Lujinxingia litoralis]RAL21734.1 hypothetical protein DL240_12840 [Lujinxingia litoralis]